MIMMSLTIMTMIMIEKRTRIFQSRRTLLSRVEASGLLVDKSALPSAHDAAVVVGEFPLEAVKLVEAFKYCLGANISHRN